jgi:soluble lytic murein transglycosylase-like protein
VRLLRKPAPALTGPNAVPPARLAALATAALAALFAAVAAAPAGAAVPHVVGPGETLWTIAAANNLTTRTVAAFNGLSENSQVVLGSTVMVPSTVEGYAALQRAGLVAATPTAAASTTGDGDGDSDDGATTASAAPTAAATPAAAPATTTAAPAPQGAYKVRPGDTLGRLAAGAGVSVDAMAAMNGIDPAAPLLVGTVLKLPAGAPAPASAGEPAPAQTVVPKASPEPTNTRLGASDVQSIASQYGVSPSLAAAVAYQESGFNNAMVSGANARGIMQVMPGTWSWVQDNLADRQLDPASAADNTAAGVLYLKRLLNETGGDEATAIAGYYQGLGSVQSRGMFDDTKRYVANVQALRSRFGG